MQKKVFWMYIKNSGTILEEYNKGVNKIPRESPQNRRTKQTRNY
jgi:hypothetical protein